MIAIAVDDEALMLRALLSAIEASPDIAEVTGFSDCDEALEFVKEKMIPYYPVKQFKCPEEVK